MNEQQPANNEKDIINPQTTTPEPVIETNHLSESVDSGKKVLVRNYAIATLIIVLMGGGLWLVLESQGRVSTNYLDAFANRGPAAVVNGVEISREDFEANRSQVQESATGQGADINDPEVMTQINNQAIETLINTELLRQEAQELNITVSNEEISARRSEIVEQVGGEEMLATRMTEIGITEEGLVSDIRDELIIQKLFAQEANTGSIEVTQQEIDEVFAQVSAGQEVEVALDDETRELIVTNIRLSKEQTLVTEYIETLRAGANVEIKF